MIKCVKLVSGEEIIGEVYGYDLGSSGKMCKTSSPDFFQIKNPAAVTMVMPQGPGQSIRIALVPICVKSVGGAIRVRHSAVIFDYDPIEEFVCNYKQMFSPLAVPASVGGLISPTGERISAAQTVQPAPPEVKSEPVVAGAFMIDNPNQDSSAELVDDWRKD